MRVHKNTRNIQYADSVIEIGLNLKTNCRMYIEVTESEITIAAAATTTTNNNNNNSAAFAAVA
jgi:outer membrane protease